MEVRVHLNVDEDIEEAGQIGDEEAGEGGEKGAVCWPSERQLRAA